MPSGLRCKYQIDTPENCNTVMGWDRMGLRGGAGGGKEEEVCLEEGAVMKWDGWLIEFHQCNCQVDVHLSIQAMFSKTSTESFLKIDIHR